MTPQAIWTYRIDKTTRLYAGHEKYLPASIAHYAVVMLRSLESVLGVSENV